MSTARLTSWIVIFAVAIAATACGGSSSKKPPAPDTTPDAFSFPPATDVEPRAIVTSEPVQIRGIDAAADVTIEGGEYRIDGGEFTSEPSEINNRQSLILQAEAPDQLDSTKEVVVTVGGVSGRFVITTLKDEEPPEAAIVFPSKASATDSTRLTVRGTAKDALSEVTRVTVTVQNDSGTTDYEVESDDNFATWKVEVALAPDTENIITVSAEDEYQNIAAEAATAVVHQQAWELAFPDEVNVFTQAEGLAYDEEGERIFIGDWGTDSVIAVDLSTGQREEFFKGEGGTGFGSASALTVDKFHNRLIVTNASRDSIYALNLEGETIPTLVNSRSHPDEEQPAFSSPRGIALDPDNPDQLFVTAVSSRNLAGLDMNTGIRTLISNNETPDDEASFSGPYGFVIDQANNRFVVTDHGSQTVLAVDRETGKRSIISDAETPNADNAFYCPSGISSDRIAERVLIGDCGLGIVSVDLSTGERLILKDIAMLHPHAGNALYLYTREGWDLLYYVDSRNDALYMLDLVTTEQVILSKGSN